jgi:hypothetical protein
VIIKRILLEFIRTDKSQQQQDTYTLLREIVENIKSGCADFGKPETVAGAIALADCTFNASTGAQERFRFVFEQLSLPMTECFKKCYS